MALFGLSSIPALLNGFDHWFRFGYTLLLESVPHPPLWTPWFPWLTCLENRCGNVMSPLPWAGPNIHPDRLHQKTTNNKKKKRWLGMDSADISGLSWTAERSFLPAPERWIQTKKKENLCPKSSRLCRTLRLCKQKWTTGVEKIKTFMKIKQNIEYI